MHNTSKDNNIIFMKRIIFLIISILVGFSYGIISGGYLNPELIKQISKRIATKEEKIQNTSKSNTKKNVAPNIESKEYVIPNETGIGFRHVVEHENGWKTVTMYGPCNLCFGKKICTVCNGSGKNVYYYPTPYSVICEACNGYGICTACHKTNGYVMTAMYGESPEGLMQDFFSFDVYNTNSFNSYSTSSGNKTCTKCGGTGIDPFALEDNINFPAYNSKKLIGYQHSDRSKACPYCKDSHKVYNYHYHIKCLSCNNP